MDDLKKSHAAALKEIEQSKNDLLTQQNADAELKIQQLVNEQIKQQELHTRAQQQAQQDLDDARQ